MLSMITSPHTIGTMLQPFLSIDRRLLFMQVKVLWVGGVRTPSTPFHAIHPIHAYKPSTRKTGPFWLAGRYSAQPLEIHHSVQSVVSHALHQAICSSHHWAG